MIFATVPAPRVNNTYIPYIARNTQKFYKVLLSLALAWENQEF